jgi:hypothetical protein
MRIGVRIGPVRVSGSTRRRRRPARNRKSVKQQQSSSPGALLVAILVVVFFFAYASHAPLVGAAIDAGIVALLLLVWVAGRKRRAALKAAPPVDISMYTHARQAWLRRHPGELVKLAAERAAKRPAQPS